MPSGKKVIRKGRRQGALPPAGDERREELKRRTADLEEQREELAEGGVEAHSVDPSAFKIDNEIASALPTIERISNAQKGFEYGWVCFRQNGLMVERAKIDGWVVVSGSDLESREHLQPDGTRRVGDVLLMRISKDKAIMIRRRHRELRIRQREGVVAPLHELAAKNSRYVIIHSDPNDPLIQRLAKQQLAKGIASKRFDAALRGGTVPGAELG